MKILFCIDTLRKGGAERVVSNLANAFIEKNIDVGILTITKTEIEYDLNSRIEVEYLQDEGCRESKTYLKVKNFINRVKLMKKRINKINPDVIVAFLPYTSFITLSSVKNIPIIVSVRNDPTTEYKSKIYNFFMRKLYPKASGFIYQTQEAKDYFNGILDKEYRIIPNSINPEFIVKNKFNGDRKREIVTVGRLYDQKNHKLLIDAFLEIKNRIPDYKLIIYGEGYKRDELQQLINNTNTNDRIFLPGNIKNVKDKIYDASLFVLSSDFEGMPNALMEAMCLGLPVISTDCPCGGPRFLIQNEENGLLIDVGNKEQLENAIIKIIDDKDFSDKISTNALKVSEALNPDKINKEWQDFIEYIYKKKNK